MDNEKPIFELSRIKVWQALYLLAFLLALGVRLLNLGAHPLTEYEASWANQALTLSRGEQVVIGPQPLYVLLTSLFFWLAKDNEAWARLLPVLSGSLLVLLPLMLRPFFPRESGDEVKRDAELAGLILAFGLALDPALVSLSRQAGSSMPALAFSLLALGLYANRHWRLAGITAGLALLSGPALFQGMLGLALAWGAARLIFRDKPAGLLAADDQTPTPPAPAGESPEQATLPDQLQNSTSPAPRKNALDMTGPRLALIFLAGTLLLVGTLFVRFPQGLGAMVNSLPAYLQGWIPGSTDLLPAPSLRLLLALAVYQPLVVLFALISALRFWLAPILFVPADGEADQAQNQIFSNRLGQQISLWALFALLAGMIYPARQVSDVVWAVIPLWALAALELARCLPTEDESRDFPIVLVHMGLTSLFVTLFFYNLLRLSVFAAQPLLFGSVLAGIVLMIAVISFLFAAGWTPGIARLGLSWGAALVLAVIMLSGMWHSAQVAPSGAGDLWGRPPAAGQVKELQNTLDDLSEWNTGFKDQLDILVTLDSAALRWALRDYPNVRFASGVTAVELASAIITPQEQETLDLAAAYRGQDFIWNEYPGWGGLIPVQVIDWLFFRRAPESNQMLILWVRADRFPGGVSNLDQMPALQPPSDALP